MIESILPKLLPTLTVALGGALGASARFWVRDYLPSITGDAFPYPTLLVNILGCFFSGLVYVWLESSDNSWSQGRMLFFFVGFLGAFTTFSAFALDSFLLFQEQHFFKLALNITANCLLCLIFVFVGAFLGARIQTVS
jgi:CrcB protein